MALDSSKERARWPGKLELSKEADGLAKLAPGNRRVLRSESPPLADPNPTCSAEVLGIHGADVTRAIPIFLAYLATLFHTFSLPVRLSSDPTGMGAALGAATGPAVDTEEASAGDVEAGTAGQQGAPYRRRSSERFLGEQLGSSVSGGLQALGLRLLQGCYAGEGVVDCLAFNKVTQLGGSHTIHAGMGCPVCGTCHPCLPVAPAPMQPTSSCCAPAPCRSGRPTLCWSPCRHRQQRRQPRRQQTAASRRPPGASSCACSCRMCWMGCGAATLRRLGSGRTSRQVLGWHLGSGVEVLAAQVGDQQAGMPGWRRQSHPLACLASFLQRTSTEEAAEGPPLTFGASRGSADTAAPSQPAAQQQTVEVAQPAGSAPAAAATGAAGAASGGFPDLSTMGPLQLTFVSVQPGSGGGSSSNGATKDSGKPSGSSSSVCALFEVTPLHSTPANSEGWCSVAGWPLRWARWRTRCKRWVVGERSSPRGLEPVKGLRC